MAKEITLEGRLDQNASSKLLSDLKDAQTDSVTIDASGVSLLGGQCLQILMSAAAYWSDNGNDLKIENPSTAFQENLVTLGVQPDSLLIVEANS